METMFNVLRHVFYEDWIELLSVMIALLCLCVMIYLFVKQKRGTYVSQLQAKIEGLEKEMAHYRDQVKNHFSKTAHLMSELATQYREIYMQMAEDAGELCDNACVQGQFQKLGIDHCKIDEQVVYPLAGSAVTPPKDYVSENTLSDMHSRFR